MDYFLQFFVFFLEIDKYLGSFIVSFGSFAYVLLFIIIFAETGFIITPFLPGDTLLFVSGTFAAQGAFHIWTLFFILFTAAVLGDTINYWIGYFIGEKFLRSDGSRFIKKEYFERTESFYEKYGGKTIVFARFIPIIRTFAPFVAGLGKMHYPRFFLFNVFGGLAWISLFVFGGYFFGNFAFVQENLSLILAIIISFSILPAIIEFVRAKSHKHCRVDKNNNLR